MRAFSVRVFVISNGCLTMMPSTPICLAQAKRLTWVLPVTALKRKKSFLHNVVEGKNKKMCNQNQNRLYHLCTEIQRDYVRTVFRKMGEVHVLLLKEHNILSFIRIRFVGSIVQVDNKIRLK